MFSNSLNIDVQIYQEEIKKPNQSSVVLVPLKHKSHVTYQLVMVFENLNNKITPQNIDQASQIIFKEWQSIFPLYPVERAFAETAVPGRVELYISFEGENIYSSTQTRNIKKTITEIVETELKRVISASAKNEAANSVNTDQATPQYAFSEKEASKRREELDLRERFNTLKQENNQLQTALESSRSEEVQQKESISELKKELERQQRSLASLTEKNTQRTPEMASAYEQLQEQLEDTANKLHQNQVDAYDKQREIQRLQAIVAENKRYADSLQSDYDQLRESSDFQTNQLLEENDKLKTEIYSYKNNELENKQEIQLIKTEMLQVAASNENIQEELSQKLQRVQYENQGLRTAIEENQKFEEQTQLELEAATNELVEVKDKAKRLESEKDLLTKEWELKYQTTKSEKDELASAYKKSRELELERNSELIDVKTKVITLEQSLQQAKLDYDQFLQNKDQEIKRLTDRLTQQKELVEKLMSNQSDSQTVLQSSYETLENNYQQANKKAVELAANIHTLTTENQKLKEALASFEAPEVVVAPIVEPTVEETVVVEAVAEPKEAVVEKEPTQEVAVVEEVSYDDGEYEEYAYEDDDEEYDYEYEDDYDYDYEYQEVDELVSYNPESIEEDINDYFDNKDESGKVKISKKDFAVYELYLDHLKELVEQATNPEFKEFKAFADSKMKKFNKFKKEFDEDVKSPTLFSRKYKMPTGLANQMKGYVLISRHLSVLLDVELSESEYEYDYDYEYDYEYDEEYNYDYEEETPKKDKKGKKGKK